MQKLIASTQPMRSIDSDTGHVLPKYTRFSLCHSKRTTYYETDVVFITWHYCERKFITNQSDTIWAILYTVSVAPNSAPKQDAIINGQFCFIRPFLILNTSHCDNQASGQFSMRTQTVRGKRSNCLSFHTIYKLRLVARSHTRSKGINKCKHQFKRHHITLVIKNRILTNVSL